MMTADREGRTLVFFPGFGATDAAEFTDQYYRVLFYTAPVRERIARIVFAVAPGLVPGELPDYLDPGIKTLVANFKDQIAFVSLDRLAAEAAAANHILHWNTSAALPEAPQASVENVDRQRFVEECQVYLNLSSKIGGSYSYRRAESHMAFKALVARHRARKCYIFGTGPNLSQAAQHDFSDGVAVACNSMVKNTALLDRLKPPLIVAGDPIFHAGASVYAAEFRTRLYQAMERYNAFFLTNQRDYRIFYAHMPEHLRERLIGAPAEWGLRMNTNPVDDFVFTACPNILTLFLIPLAHVLGREDIAIAGCDGRPLADNNYFWQHDKSVQFSDKMGDIQRAHPSFFDIDYDDYYFLHCETVSHWLQQAEREGRKVVNMTPSFIPALQERYRPIGGLKGTGQATGAVPFRVRASMKRVFWQRQWRVIRQGILPAWRHALRVRVTRMLSSAAT